MSESSESKKGSKNIQSQPSLTVSDLTATPTTTGKVSSCSQSEKKLTPSVTVISTSACFSSTSSPSGHLQSQKTSTHSTFMYDIPVSPLIQSPSTAQQQQAQQQQQSQEASQKSSPLSTSKKLSQCLSEHIEECDTQIKVALYHLSKKENQEAVKSLEKVRQLNKKRQCQLQFHETALLTNCAALEQKVVSLQQREKHLLQSHAKMEEKLKNLSSLFDDEIEAPPCKKKLFDE